ncbi:NACHT domain-containing protein [Streptomyces pseudovenezuelae]|uniref:NACHT domain-containing protein n=1 Tax=Streptomyces pseudovenezuelae TaxID=67350 RepID=UPI002475CD51|nr:NACHT domain-containing protein [Streptomyces pseudovenezuelae]
MLVGRRKVLTALHVVADAVSVDVVHPSSGKPVACQLSWADEALDVALLLTSENVIGDYLAAPMGQLRLGRVATDAPLPHCEVVGFPEIQRYGKYGEDLDYDQYRVSVLPLAGRVKGVLTCELDRPAAEWERVGSPLAGLSGAPVFAGPVLLGVVTQVPQSRQHLRIEGAAIADIVEQGAVLAADPWLEEITEVHPQDEHFEARYAKDLSSQYRRTEIFGIEELGRSESRWDLDTAYLSLRAEGPAHSYRPVGSTRPRTAWSGAQRIDSLLTDRPRALLRGEAGAGKTTLVRWLAAHAANSTLSGDLAQLNGLVPFVVPLREVHGGGGRFPAVSELLSAGRTITDGQPDGWAGRVLEARRGFLLVDGLDEVPEAEREEARRWLAALLDRYPGTRCLATVRPNAVDKQWLDDDGFAELTLLPMSDDDIRAFVRAWHNAARLECDHFYDGRRAGEERELLSSLEHDLVHQLERNAALSDLARTPLLCAVICALHRRRRGLMPTTRWQLYRAALAMLLGGRDAGRGVLHAGQIKLDSDEQHALLQRLAIWLVRTGQQQMTHSEAAHQLSLAMRDMPSVQEQSSPDEVLRFLLDRSGLLQERADDAIQFIHRTFQDFLAAKEFHESGYLLELMEHADSEAWEDVIVLAVGHAARPEASRLIDTLLGFGDVAEHRSERFRLHVLAARCATNAQLLSQPAMDAVKARVDALMPPRDPEEIEKLAGLGDWVVGVLPDGEQLRDRVALNTVRLLGRVRSAKSRHKLRQCVFHPDPPIRGEVAWAWALHPVEEYMSEVMEGAFLPDLLVDKREQLVRLRRLAAVTRLTVRGSYDPLELDANLPVQQLESLAIWNNDVVTRLDFLHVREDLRSLELRDCGSLEDLSVLAGLDLTALRVTGGGGQILRPLPGVHHLEVGVEAIKRLDALEAWTELRSLTVEGLSHSPAWHIRAALHAPQLTRIALAIDSLQELKRLNPMPRIERLMITGLENHTDVEELSRVFPNLRKLGMGLVKAGTLDLRPLHELPDLRLELWSTASARLDLLGEEAFGDRLRFHEGDLSY